MRSISREDLFKDAWTRPLSRIAAEFGVSDTALRKTCDRHDIPTSGRGYWAQVASGKSFPRPVLRPAKEPHLKTVRIVGAVQPSPEMKAIIDRVKAERATKPTPNQVPCSQGNSPRSQTRGDATLFRVRNDPETGQINGLRDEFGRQ
jgi:hypothetical protein